MESSLPAILSRFRAAVKCSVLRPTPHAFPRGPVQSRCVLTPQSTGLGTARLRTRVELFKNIQKCSIAQLTASSSPLLPHLHLQTRHLPVAPHEQEILR